ncbi:hypothetical protein RMR16_020550 [Agrobacterium sp. rho-13.3]|uniref:hypothetical protein n=1 Tax=Agrobacterium sp. rho-13.3 TaxID=3072980 RepID=UPI002A1054C6|nr:hypothetical protein [Agrobacterium sp. rho-13.3]MDX8306295.1 hypothetical protein [Agrobacterium sp. rho-13.3]MDX8307374.1 hypothetical protein [Agrobacterium sp. rho-13.3]
MVDSTGIEPNNNRSYVDWPAIFAGAAISSGAVAVLTAFAGGLGLSSISANDGGDISTIWLIITALFVVISMVGSYMLGGYITGRMRRPAGSADRNELTIRDGVNGLVVWGLGTVVSAVLALSVVTGAAKAVGSVAQTAVEATGSVVGGAAQGAGQLAGGIASAAGSAVGGIAQGAGQAAAPTIEQALPQGAKSNPVDYFTDVLLRTDPQTTQPGDQNVVDFQRQASGVLTNLLTTGEISDADRTWLANQIAARTSISQADAQTRVNETVGRIQAIRTDAQKKVDDAKKQIEDLQAQAAKALEEAKTKAADAAEKARVAGILSAFLLAASALISAAAAYIGAVHGGRHRDEGRIWGGLNYNK